MSETNRIFIQIKLIKACNLYIINKKLSEIRMKLTKIFLLQVMCALIVSCIVMTSDPNTIRVIQRPWELKQESFSLSLDMKDGKNVE